MKLYKLFLFTTLLLLSNCSRWSYNIDHYYDEFDGYTIDRMQGNNIHYGVNPIWLNAQRYISKYGIRSYNLIIETARSSWLFIEEGNSLTLLLDGETMRFYGDGSREHREVEESSCWETAFYPITEDQLKKIASSKEIKLKLVGSNGIVTETCAKKVAENFKEFVLDYVEK